MLLIIMTVLLVVMLCMLAYTLAVYALPFMIGLTAAQFAYSTGSGLIGAGIVGLVTAALVFGILVFLFEAVEHPFPRLIVALIFAVPAAIAGYALVSGIAKEAVPSPVWQQIFCIMGSIGIGGAAAFKLARS